MGNSRGYSLFDDDRIRRLHTSGMSVGEIATRLRRSKSAMYRKLSEMGLLQARLAFDRAPENPRILELYGQGDNDTAIGRKLGLTKGQVHARRHAMGLLEDHKAERAAQSLAEACDDHLADLERAHKPGIGELHNPGAARAVWLPTVTELCSGMGSPAALCVGESTGGPGHGSGTHRQSIRAGLGRETPPVTLPRVRFLEGPAV